MTINRKLFNQLMILNFLHFTILYSCKQKTFDFGFDDQTKQASPTRHFGLWKRVILSQPTITTILFNREQKQVKLNAAE